MWLFVVKASVQRGTRAIICLKNELFAIDCVRHRNCGCSKCAVAIEVRNTQEGKILENERNIG